jgi:FkbM family methyltransferase
MAIPIIIVCYKNWKYVLHMLDQLAQLNPRLLEQVVILNNSPDSTLPANLHAGVQVLHRPNNQGPMVSPWVNKDIYEMMPDQFVLTDADLDLNINLPVDFLEQLQTLAKTYKNGKVGLALDISDPHLFYSDTEYSSGKSIVDQELQFWTKPLSKDVYQADVDTTFALHTKYYEVSYRNPSIRVAGCFTARHLPWYRQNPLMTIFEEFLQHKTNTPYSHCAPLFLRNLQKQNIWPVSKRGHDFLVHGTPQNQDFWQLKYPTYEEDRFGVYDKYLSKDHVMIDLGAWNGCTCLYAKDLCQHVISVEPDPLAVKELQANIVLNDATSKITVIEKAVHARDHHFVRFGKNQFCENSALNSSTSQITEKPDNDAVIVPTVSLASILKDAGNVNFIKVDIQGAEEFIMADLLKLKSVHRWISFHCNWWKNQDLTRFPELAPYLDVLHKTPCTSIFFEAEPQQ